MPATRVVLYQEANGSCPFEEWFDRLPSKAQAKCRVRLERLREMFGLSGIHHRILYFFHGTVAAVVSHGIVKESVPPKEIDQAVKRKKRFEDNPVKHSREEV